MKEMYYEILLASTKKRIAKCKAADLMTTLKRIKRDTKLSQAQLIVDPILENT